MSTKILGSLVGLLLMTPCLVNADTIVDTGVPGQSELRSTVRNNSFGTGDVYPSWRAGQFELTDAYSLNGFAAWTAVQTQGLIRWAIYSNSGSSLPGALGTFLWSVQSLSPAITSDPTWVSVDGFSVELAAGTYWLALEIPIGEPTFLLRPFGNSFDNTLPPNPLPAEAGTFGAQPWPDIAWDLSGSSFGYRIFGDLLDGPPSVPEPGTLALLGLGLAGLGLSRRRLSA